MNTPADKQHFLETVAHSLTDNVGTKRIALEMEQLRPPQDPRPKLAREWVALRWAAGVTPDLDYAGTLARLALLCTPEAHSPDCDTQDRNPDGIAKPCNCRPTVAQAQFDVLRAASELEIFLRENAMEGDAARLVFQPLDEETAYALASKMAVLSAALAWLRAGAPERLAQALADAGEAAEGKAP